MRRDEMRSLCMNGIHSYITLTTINQSIISVTLMKLSCWKEQGIIGIDQMVELLVNLLILVVILLQILLLLLLLLLILLI
jgi:hypothetical protein